MTAQMKSDTSNFLHKIYTNDPVLFKSYVNKRIKITTDDANVHTGIVYTVDPVSESIVVMEPKEGGEMKMKIIMRHAIKIVECSHDTQDVLPELFVAPPMHYAEDELVSRKNSVVKLLRESRFPVTEEKNGVLLIQDTVRIEPPYRPENCICLNSIILNRLQTLISRVSN